MTIEQTLSNLTKSNEELTAAVKELIATLKSANNSKVGQSSNQPKSLNSSPEEYVHVGNKTHKQKPPKKEPTGVGMKKTELRKKIKDITKDGVLTNDQVKCVIEKETGKTELTELDLSECEKVENGIDDLLSGRGNDLLDEISQKVDKLVEIDDDDGDDMYDNIDEPKTLEMADLKKTLALSQAKGIDPKIVRRIMIAETEKTARGDLTGEDRYKFNQALLAHIETVE